MVYVAFGTGKNLRYFHINDIASELGEAKSKAILAFHSFTGCDTTLAFYGKGKTTAWEA
jgi:hypothetical protein